MGGGVYVFWGMFGLVLWFYALNWLELGCIATSGFLSLCSFLVVHVCLVRLLRIALGVVAWIAFWFEACPLRLADCCLFDRISFELLLFCFVDWCFLFDWMVCIGCRL